MAVAIYPFPNSSRYAIHAETLQYFVLKNGSERLIFEDDFILYFYKAFYSFSNRFITTKPKQLKLSYFLKGFAQRSEKVDYFDPLTKSLSRTD